MVSFFLEYLISCIFSSYEHKKASEYEITETYRLQDTHGAASECFTLNVRNMQTLAFSLDRD